MYSPSEHPRIDSHQHFWKFEPEQHAWMTPDMGPIRKDFLPEDLEPRLRESAMDGCITVQVDQTAKETLTLLRHADLHSFIRGVVGWIDLRSPAVEEQLIFLKSYSKLKGFRHIVQSEPEGFLLQKEFMHGISLLSRHGFTYDILIYPRQLQEAIQFVRQFPEQKFIVDHLAKPPIKDKSIEPWKKNITTLANAGNVYCKVSGMVTEADWKNWKQNDFRPYLDVILNAFGTKRMVYGSDWPVCLLAASYSQQIGIIEEFLRSLSDSEKQLVMGRNAIQFYNL